jgi:endogenous inhibitor of DNA gyrase (YacG/DUF329 family)
VIEGYLRGDGRRDMTDQAKQVKGTCPECGEETVYRYRPFCSRRCANLDLSRWLRGTYAIAGGNADADDDGDEAEALELAKQARQGSGSDGDGNGGGSRLH